MTDLGSVAAIVGMGDAYADKENRKDPLQLASEAAWAAIRDAGIDKKDIQVVLTGRPPWADLRPQWSNIIAAYLQLPVIFTSEVAMHGTGANAMLGLAAMLLKAGRADHILCLEADASPLFVDAVAIGAEVDADPQFERPHGPTIPSLYAQSACRYMHEFGVSEADFAEVAVQHQEWGRQHPKAAKRKYGSISVEQVLESPYVASPLRRWMCATWGPGGTAGAFVLTHAERARDAARPIYLRGFGSCAIHEYLTEKMALRDSPFDLGPLPTLTHTAALEVGRQAYEMAGMGPQDMDLVQLSGNFSHTVLMQLEDLGFADKGKAMDLVRSGRMLPGGDLPVDTNGGFLSFGQPGMSCITDALVENVRQLRGDALGPQVPDARTALFYAQGGMFACHSSTILSTEPA